MTRSLFGEGTQAIGGSPTSSYLDSPQLVRLGNIISDALVVWDPNISGRTTMTGYSLQRRRFWPSAHAPRYMLQWHISRKENILSCLGYNQLKFLVGCQGHFNLEYIDCPIWAKRTWIYSTSDLWYGIYENKCCAFSLQLYSNIMHYISCSQFLTSYLHVYKKNNIV